MLYPEAFLDHRKERPRNIHAFKEDSLEIMMMTNSNLGTRINFMRKIYLMQFCYIRSICSGNPTAGKHTER